MGTIPADSQSVQKLAQDLAAAYHGHLADVWTPTAWSSGVGFAIKDISESDIRRMANDPRILYIEPDVYAHTSGASPQVFERLGHHSIT